MATNILLVLGIALSAANLVLLIKLLRSPKKERGFMIKTESGGALERNNRIDRIARFAK